MARRARVASSRSLRAVACILGADVAGGSAGVGDGD
jgi:hypothetical protein